MVVMMISTLIMVVIVIVVVIAIAVVILIAVVIAVMAVALMMVVVGECQMDGVLNLPPIPRHHNDSDREIRDVVGTKAVHSHQEAVDQQHPSMDEE